MATYDEFNWDRHLNKYLLIYTTNGETYQGYLIREPQLDSYDYEPFLTLQGKEDGKEHYLSLVNKNHIVGVDVYPDHDAATSECINSLG